jgi:hypothetical protein
VTSVMEHLRSLTRIGRNHNYSASESGFPLARD